jgi:hypothetical protein
MWSNVDYKEQKYHSINWRHRLHHHLLEQSYRKKYHKKIQILMMTNNKKHLIRHRQHNPMMETLKRRHNRDRTIRTKINSRTNKQMTKRISKRFNKKIMNR